MIRAADIAGAAENLLFPRRCPVCDKPVHPFGALICPECAAALSPIRGSICAKCGKPLREASEEYCYDCRRIPHHYGRGCAVYPYRSVSGSIYRLKYEGRAEYADYYGHVMAERIRAQFHRREVGLLVPVPASRERTRERGYNQAALLARRIAAETGIPEREDLLLRVRNTPVLRSLDIAARHKKLENAFIVHGNDVESSCIMLIDDIYTTGSTIDACASALTGAGARCVNFCTLAIGESYL